MRIHDDTGLSECGPQDHVGGFAADTGQFDQRVQAVRYQSTVGFRQNPTAGLDVFGLVAIETGGAYQSLDFLEGGQHEILRALELLKELGGDTIDLFVRALRRQNGGQQQFEGVAKMELRLDFGIRGP
jgi:hypothetical protein